ncbi:hypothetical protein K1719_025267 [Acacia pycnantha]|nr:hypothetical protein K1719_025267 [Acacia pycnantha]
MCETGVEGVIIDAALRRRRSYLTKGVPKNKRANLSLILQLAPDPSQLTKLQVIPNNLVFLFLDLLAGLVASDELTAVCLVAEDIWSVAVN